MRHLYALIPLYSPRPEILKILLRDETLGPDLDPKVIVAKTEGFSGSDLKHLCVSAALDAVKEHVVVPWSSAPEPAHQNLGGASATSIEDASNISSGVTADDVAPPAALPRVLHLRHFNKALKEITPSSSEFSGTLADLRKWNDEFGEGRRNKKRQPV